MYIHTDMRVYIYIYTYIYIYMCVYVSIYVHVSIYVYIYIVLIRKDVIIRICSKVPSCISTWASQLFPHRARLGDIFWHGKIKKSR